MIQFDGAKVPSGSPVLKAVSYDYGKAQRVGWQEAFTTLSGMLAYPSSLSLLTMVDLVEKAINMWLVLWYLLARCFTTAHTSMQCDTYTLLQIP